MVLHHILGGPLSELNDCEMGEFERSASVHMPLMFGFVLLRITEPDQIPSSLPPEDLLPQSEWIITWELLHTKKRQDDTCEHLNAVLGDSRISCELQLAGPEYEGFQLGFSSLSLAVEEELFSSELSNEESYSQALAPDLKRLKKANITFDNHLSPAHTLLQIHCVDQKSLFYDIMRTLKDCNIKIAYSRFSSIRKGCLDVDLFIQQMDGKRILDPERQSFLYSCLKTEMLHPFRVVIASHGPDTELLVANPVELSGKGRPHVFYVVTVFLKVLGICIFSVRA